jgi:hypothetical protein
MRDFAIDLLAGSSLTETTSAAEYGPCLLKGRVVIDDVLRETEGGGKRRREVGGGKKAERVWF